MAQECNFSKAGNVNAVVAGLTDIELGRLSSLYLAEVNYAVTIQGQLGRPVGGASFMRTHDDTSPLLNIIAGRGASAATMLRLKAAFGQVKTDAAVARYSTTAVQGAYFSAPHPSSLPRSVAQMKEQGLDATEATVSTASMLEQLDMTIYEIYLDYYTAGNISRSAALTMTGRTVGFEISFAFSIGYGIGTGVMTLADTVDPGFKDRVSIAIGDIVDLGYQEWQSMLGEGGAISCHAKGCDRR